MTRAALHIITACLAFTAATAAFAGGIEPGDHVEMAHQTVERLGLWAHAS